MVKPSHLQKNKSPNIKIRIARYTEKKESKEIICLNFMENKTDAQSNTESKEVIQQNGKLSKN